MIREEKNEQEKNGTEITETTQNIALRLDTTTTATATAAASAKSQQCLLMEGPPSHRLPFTARLLTIVLLC